MTHQDGHHAQDAQSRLEAALREDDLEAVEAALREGADPNRLDGAGHPPLVQACRLPGIPGRRAARALLDAGADVTWRDREHGWTPLHHAVAGPGDAQLIELLLERGADADVTTSWGETPLQRALRDQLVEKALVLARVTKAPDAKNASGASARSLAGELAARVASIVDALDGEPTAPPPAGP
ncbi:MAG: ankyrin repeat domain-containing protein [Planctomycetota bacterium]|nr:ankyrin repeat domain-containing protein [Planctomycetota bacterium]MCB9902484.1 ankyrin repeat domain-containing protein [Planctomycetota bacterium]